MHRTFVAESGYLKNALDVKCEELLLASQEHQQSQAAHDIRHAALNAEIVDLKQKLAKYANTCLRLSTHLRGAKGNVGEFGQSCMLECVTELGTAEPKKRATSRDWSEESYYSIVDQFESDW